MARACTICTHPSRDTIDRELATGRPNRRIASRFHLSEASIRRHKASHLPASLIKSAAAADVASADGLLARLKGLNRETAAILKECRTSGKDTKLALAAIARAERQLALESDLLTALHEARLKDEAKPQSSDRTEHLGVHEQRERLFRMLAKIAARVGETRGETIPYTITVTAGHERRLLLPKAESSDP